MSNCKFYVLEFEDGLEVVRCEWAVKDNNGEVIAAYFPPSCDKTKLSHLLKTQNCPIAEKWDLYNAKYHKSAGTLDKAYKLLTLVQELSEIESDDGKNYEKLKKSRHIRWKKSDENFVTAGVGKEKSMKNSFLPLRAIENLSTSTVESNSSAKSSNLSNGLGDNEIYERVDLIDEQTDKHTSEPTSKNGERDDPTDEVTNQSDNKVTSQSVPGPGLSNEIQNNDAPAPIARKRVKKRSRFEDSEEDIKRLKMNEKDILLFKKINTIGVMVEVIANRENCGRPTDGVPQNVFNFYGESDDSNPFPIKNMEELNNIENKLASKNFTKNLISSLERLGALTTLSLTVRRILTILMTDEVGIKYSFEGRKHKYVFKKLRIYKVVITTVLNILSNEKVSSIEKWIKDWLAQCKTRITREQEKLTKRTAAEEAQRLEEDLQEED